LVPPGRDRRRFIAISLIDALGTGVFVPLTVLYLTEIVRLPAVEVGAGIAITGAVGIVAASAAGPIVDAVDSRGVAIVSFAISGIGFLLYTRVSSFPTFLAVGSLIQTAERLAQASRRMVALAVAEGSDRLELFAYERSTRNVGYGLGGLLASVALAGGTREFYVAVLVGNACTFFAGAAGLATLPAAPPAACVRTGGYGAVIRDYRYVGLALVTTVLWFNDSILKIGLPLWVVTRTSAPPFVVGLLFTLNTLIVVAFQVRVSRGASSLHGIGRAYARAGLMLLWASIMLAVGAYAGVAAAIVLLVLAVCVLTAGELFSAASEWGASITLAREELRGRYLAVFATGASAQQAAGPAIVTVALSRAGTAAWMAFGAVMLAAGLVGRRLTVGASSRSPS
jgi:hypothetical protein